METLVPSLISFSPPKEKAEEAVKKFGEAGVGVAAYWYTNMFHFINQWDHLKNLKSIAPMAIQHMDLPQDYNNLDLPKSQDVMSRLISVGIRGTWKQDELEQLANKMEGVLKSVLKPNLCSEILKALIKLPMEGAAFKNWEKFWNRIELKIRDTSFFVWMNILKTT